MSTTPAAKGFIARAYPGIPQIATVTCGCGVWDDFDCDPGEDSAKKCRAMGWRRIKGLGWVCPACQKNQKAIG